MSCLVQNGTDRVLSWGVVVYHFSLPSSLAVLMSVLDSGGIIVA